MKTTGLAFALAVATASAALAQPGALAPAPAAATPVPDAYAAALLAAIAEQDAATAPAALQANLARLSRVAAAAPAAWEARYYQARACIKLGVAGKDGDAQDQWFDQAQAALDAGLKLPGADRAELLVLQAYALQGRIMVAPMLRGAAYSGRVQEALNEARVLSPGNPRVYLLLGNDLYFRPAVFGGGADKAKPLYEKALVLFDAYRPASPLSPAWGKGNAVSALARINAPVAAK